MAAFAVGAGLGALGSFMNSRAQAQQRQWLTGIIQNLQEAAQRGENHAIDALNRLAPVWDQMNRSSAMLWGEGNDGAATSLYDWMRGTRPGSFEETMGGMFDPGGYQAQMNNLLSLNEMFGGNEAAINQILSQGGTTGRMQTIGDVAATMGGGTGLEIPTREGGRLMGTQGRTDTTMGLNELAQETTRLRGMTAPMTGLQQIAGDIYTDRGRTPGIDSLAGLGGRAAEGEFGIGGLTPTGAAAEGTALETLLTGGATEGGDFLRDRGMDLAGREALIPMEQRIAMARDQVGTQGLKNYQNILKRAYRRGGGPSTIMAGNQNDVIAQFGDDLLQQEASAVRDAITDQQKLQLTQQGQGLESVRSGEDIAGSRIANAGDLTAALENAATGRFSAGGDLMLGGERLASDRMFRGLDYIPQIEQFATGRLATLGGLGLDAGRQELAGMDLGSRMLDTAQNRQLSALNLAMAPEEFAMRNMFGGIGARGSNLANWQNLFTNYGDMARGGAQTQGGLLGGYYDILGGAQGREFDFNRLMFDNIMRGGGIGSDTVGQWINFANAARSGVGGLAGGGGGGTNPWANFFQQTGAGMANSNPFNWGGGGGNDFPEYMGGT